MAKKEKEKIEAEAKARKEKEKTEAENKAKKEKEMKEKMEKNKKDADSKDIEIKENLNKTQVKPSSTSLGTQKTSDQQKDDKITSEKAKETKKKKESKKGKDDDEKSFKKSTSSLNKLMSVTLFPKKDKNKTKPKSFEKEDLLSMRKNFAMSQGVKKIETPSKPPPHPQAGAREDKLVGSTQAGSTASQPAAAGGNTSEKPKSFKPEDLEAVRHNFAESQGVIKIEPREDISLPKMKESQHKTQQSPTNKDENRACDEDKAQMVANHDLLENTVQFEPEISEKKAFELKGTAQRDYPEEIERQEVVEEICVETKAAVLTGAAQDEKVDDNQRQEVVEDICVETKSAVFTGATQ